MERIDCDVFMKDGTSLDINKVILITGNFYAGSNCYISSGIIAGENVILSEGADTVGICAGGDVYVGKFSKTHSILADGSVFLDDSATAKRIFSKNDVILGRDAFVLNIDANDIIVDACFRSKSFFSRIFEELEFFFFGR